jgi:predicted TIM-barrel fold metal-dependent hydrolase
MKLDVFNHILPKALYEELCRLAPSNMALNAFKTLPELWDLDAHLKLMDGFADYQQILSLSNPPIEMLGGPDATPGLARFANDGLAELVRRHPDRFPGFIASLPMNNPEAAVREADRAITELKASGIQIYTNVLGKPLSAPEFLPLFETMAKHDLPVWIHPMRGPNAPDYATETVSENEIWFTFGWPYETSACVTRLIFAGIFDKLPRLKIITHHMGGMIPYFADKIALGFRQIFHGEMDRNPAAADAGLKRQPIEYFRMLYGDTALNGSAAATKCGHAFFTTERSLFATDAPFDSEGGRVLIGRTIAAIDALEIPDAERQRIFSGNAKALLRLA